MKAALAGPRYELVELVGRGGMGEVMRAFDRVRDEHVALKMFSERSPMPLAAEFRFIAELDHPGVVSVFDFGLTVDRRSFFTMELIEGRDLQTYASSVELRPAMRALRMVLDTLAFVHARGVVHGDLKPSNVLVAGRADAPQPKLLDFGVAWDVRRPPQGFAGTLRYMAPEIVLGEPTDHRVDLYALGVMLFRLLTGVHPFASRDAQSLLAAHVSQRVPDPRDIAPETPAALAELSLRLLEKQPADRPAGAHDVSAAIDSWLGAQHVEVPDARVVSGGSRFAGREDELRVLLTAAKELGRGGRAGLFVVRGDPGSGKTRLLQELQVRLQVDGIRCITVKFEGCESPRDAIWRVANTMAALFGDDAGRSAMDELEREPESRRMGLTPADLLVQIAFPVGEACARLASNEPLVLCLDGIHEAPAEATTALRMLIETIVRAPVMVVATTREATGVLDGMRPSGRFELPPLARPATSEVVRSLLGKVESPEVIDEHVQTESGGNPAAIERVVRTLVAQGAMVPRRGGWVVADHLNTLPVLTEDAGVREIARAKLRRLDAEALSVAQAAAVIGMSFEQDLVRAVLVDARAVEARLRTLTDARIVEPSLTARGVGYRFTQRLLCDVLLEPIDPVVGLAMSQRLVDYLRSLPDSADVMALRIRHLLRCGLRLEAAETAGRLILSTHHVGTPGDVGKQLGEALGDSPDQANFSRKRWCELASTLADHEKRLGNVREAASWYARVIERARGDASVRLRVDALRELGDLRMQQGDGGGEAMLRQALLEAETIGDPLSLGGVEYAVANRLVFAGRFEEAERGAAAALSLAERANDAALRARALKLRATIHWYFGRHALAEVDARAAVKAYQGIGAGVGAAQALGSLGNALWSRHQLDDAARAFDEALGYARASSWRHGIQKLLVGRGCVAFERGDWDEAEELFEGALRIALRIDDSAGRAQVKHNLAYLFMLRGAYDAAQAGFGEVTELARAGGFAKVEARALCDRAELELRRGDLRAARRMLDDCREALRHVEAKDVSADQSCLELELALASGASPEHVARDAAQLTADVEREGLVMVVPRGLCIGGEALARAGKPEEARVALDAAERGYRAQEAHFAAARVVRVVATLAAERLLSPTGVLSRLKDAQRLLRKLRAQPELDRLRWAKALLSPEEAIRDGLGRKARAEWSSSTMATTRATSGSEESTTVQVTANLSRILDAALEAAGAEFGVVLACDARGELIVRARSGRSTTEDELSIERSIAAWVVDAGRQLIVSDAAETTATLPTPVVRTGLRTLVCLPLICESRLVGVLSLCSRATASSLSRRDIELVERLAEQAALAVA